jgi:hypothetical protein
MTPREYAVLPAAGAAALGVPLEPLGYPPEVGFLFCETDTGEHVTIMTGDAEYVRLLGNCNAEQIVELVIPEDKFPLQRAGWSDEW